MHLILFRTLTFIGMNYLMSFVLEEHRIMIT